MTDRCSPDPQQLASGEAMAVSWTAEEYFADRTAITRSALGLLVADPIAFQQREQGLDDGDEEDDETDALRFGTASHLALLEPNEWFRRVGVPKIPKPDGARKSDAVGSRGRMLYEEWSQAVAQREAIMARIPDRLDVSADEVARVRKVVESVWSHPAAVALFTAPGVTEQTVIWREPTTGVLCKVRLDRFAELAEEHVYGTKLEVGPAVCDLKTARDHRAHAFARAVRDRGYLVQAAFYADATAALIQRAPSFHFVAVRSKKPRTAVYTLTEEQLARGRAEYQRRLRTLVDRRYADDWRLPEERDAEELPL